MTMEGTKAIRKSCDLCYRRRMKCDGQKPRCSNCVSYEVDCTYMAPSRVAAPKKRRKNIRVKDGVSATQCRFEGLGNVFQNITERLETVERRSEQEPALQHEDASMMNTVLSEDDNGFSKSWNLPPMEHALPIIQKYLQDFNSVLPLFHGETLLQLVQDAYCAEPLQRNPVAWAAIHVVLALAQRQNIVISHQIPSSVVCISKVESVLSRVVLGDTKLLNVQVLVGMVMLLQAAQDAKPALILIATAIRLAHAIGLHDQAYSAHLNALEAKERACVFWLAYILDKDLSMRSKQPSIQVDDDINLDLPSLVVLQSDKNSSEFSNTDDPTSVIATTDETIRMNYLTARVHLAAVQGGVYDYIYSTRSRKRNPEERSRALDSVASALEQWKVSIPLELNASAASKRLAPGMLRFLGELHCTSLACITLINQAHAWDAGWIASLRKYGSQGIVPLLPPKWEVLVGEARDLLILFGTMGETDRYYFWTTGCSYMTAMVLLIANSMCRPRHGNVFLDNHLVEIGLQTVDRMVKETESELLQSFQDTCTELHRQTQEKCAQAAIMANKANWSSNAVTVQHGFEGDDYHDGF